MTKQTDTAILKQLPACFLCIRTNVVKFPTGNSYCFPPLWQFSQLLSNDPHILLFKKRNNFLSCCSFLPPLPLPSLPLPSFHASSNMVKRYLLFALAISAGVLVALWVACWTHLQWIHTAALLYRKQYFIPSPPTGYLTILTPPFIHYNCL